MAYLIAARTWSEPSVRKVKLFHAKWACLLLIIVDELILLCSGHGCVSFVRKDECT